MYSQNQFKCMVSQKEQTCKTSRNELQSFLNTITEAYGRPNTQIELMTWVHSMLLNCIGCKNTKTTSIFSPCLRNGRRSQIWWCTASVVVFDQFWRPWFQATFCFQCGHQILSSFWKTNSKVHNLKSYALGVILSHDNVWFIISMMLNPIQEYTHKTFFIWNRKMSYKNKSVCHNLGF